MNTTLDWPWSWLRHPFRRRQRGNPQPPADRSSAPRTADGDAKAREGGPDASAAGSADASAAGAQARFGGGGNDPAEWVTVYVANALEEAHVVKGALEVEDIPVLLRYDSFGVVYGLTLGRGVQVMVPRVVEDRARAVLAGEE